MFDLTSFVLFFIASWTLIITPGPDMLYVITRGVAQGRKAGLHSAFGVTLGIFVHTLLAAFGLAALLQTSAVAFLAIKYTGAAYLIYLGLKSFRDKGGLGNSEQQNPVAARAIFWQGFISNVTNPKIAIFFLAFLPQFVRPAGGPAVIQLLVLGLIFVTLSAGYTSVLAWAAGSLGLWLFSHAGMARWQGKITGSVYIGLGIRLILQRSE